MTYGYRLSGKAERYFARVVERQQRRIVLRIEQICAEPYDEGLSVPLQGRRDGLRRARVGDLRILFYVDDEIRVVDVTEIGPRGDIYRD